jgi:hypothetical protein
MPPASKVVVKADLSPEMIAKIASRLAGDQPECDEHEVVEKAIKLLRAAEVGSLTEKQERKLLEGLFERDETEWEADLAHYEGDLRLLAERYEQTFFEVDFVLRQLFRNKCETGGSRCEKFLALVRHAQSAGHRLYSASGESLEVSGEKAQGWLEAEEIDALTCRWLVVARQRQIGEIRRAAAGVENKY